MKNIPSKQIIIRAVCHLASLGQKGMSLCSKYANYRQLVFFVMIALLSLGSFVGSVPEAEATGSCAWYTVRYGDTLGQIAALHQSNIWSIAQANRIANVNWITTGRRLCIPLGGSAGRSGGAPGPLQWSSSQQVGALLRQAAARYGLPANLVMAIAWQESGWNQHIISHDGGIGVMQIMPYTARALNVQVRGHYNPYLTQDNITLGAIYLHSLWLGFHGNIVKVISGYNEGGWNVMHRGIFNWPYVRSVLALMHRF